MSINKSYNFAAEQVGNVSKYIDSKSTVSVLGIPGAGITLFLKHLSNQPYGHSVYIDVFSLPSFTAPEFYKALLVKLGGTTKSALVEELVSACIKQIESLALVNNKVIIYVAGFDQLQSEFSTNFFQHLRSIRNVNPSKVMFVFGICRRLDTILPADLMNTDLNLFSSVYYLKPYSNQDIQYLLSVYGPQTDLSEAEIERLIGLSGGHFQFLQLLLNSENRNNPVHDAFIQLAFKNIFMHLTAPQKAALRKIAANGTPARVDDYLIQLGIINKAGTTYKVFSPLFAECIRAYSAPKLPVKERRLLAILKKNEGKIVSKREIYDMVWPRTEVGSEWALNALVYRLRKHPAFTAQNYTIENHKKLGYSLTKNF